MNLNHHYHEARSSAFEEKCQNRGGFEPWDCRFRILIFLTVIGIVLLQGCGSRSEMEWKRQVDAGTDCYGKGDYVEAERRMTEALRYAEDQFGHMSPEVAFTLYDLARVADKQHQLLRADTMYSNAAEVFRQLDRQHDIDFANYSYTRAEHYKDMGKWPEAESCYAVALRLRLQFLGRDDPWTAMAYGGLAEAQAISGNLKESIRNHLEAIRIDRSMGTFQATYNLAMSLNRLAENYARLGDTAKTLDCMREALSVTEKVSGRESAAFAHSLWTLGSCYLSMNMMTESDSCFREAHEIAERNMPQNDHALVALRTSAALALSREKKYAEAETLINQAISLSESQPGSDPNGHIAALATQSKIFYNTEKYTQGLETAKRAMACVAEAGPSQKESMPPCLNLAAKSAYKLGHDEDAVTYSRDAWERAKELYGESDTKTLKYKKAYEEMQKDVSKVK